MAEGILYFKKDEKSLTDVKNDILKSLQVGWVVKIHYQMQTIMLQYFHPLKSDVNIY